MRSILIGSLFVGALGCADDTITTAQVSQAISTPTLRVRDVTGANRSTTLTGTEYYSVQTEPVLWQNGREVFVLSADSKYSYDYPGRSFDGYLVVGHTFNTSASQPYTVNMGYVDSTGAARALDVWFPAFATTNGRKMIFYVGRDGSTYYADREHDGVNQETELMAPWEALQQQHVARARPIIVGTWTPMAAAPAELAGRFGHLADAYASELIVWGGSGANGPLYDGAIYNPTSNTWRMLPPVTPAIAGRSGHAAIFSGKGPAIVVWGGVDSGGFARNDGSMLDLNTNQWSKITGAPIPARSNASIMWGPNGDVVVWGGDDRADGAIWNVFSRTWRTIPPAPVGRTGAQATQVGAASVAFFGGRNGNVVQTGGLILDLVSGGWTTFDPGFGPREYVEPIQAERFYFGGISPNGTQYDDGAYTESPWSFATWETVASPGTLFAGRYGAGAWRGREGHCILGGKGIGWEQAPNLGGCWSSQVRDWQPIAWMPGPHELWAFPGVAYTGDNVMMWGGHTLSGYHRDGWVYRY